MNRFLIFGSRGFPDMGLVYDTVANIHERWPDAVIVSGACYDSPDVWAEEAAHVLDMSEPDVYPADWKKHGKAAGFIRNGEMVDSLDDGDFAVGFWDGKSKGTWDTVKKLAAAKKNCDLRIRYHGRSNRNRST